MTKILRRPVHGVFLLNKPLGISSNAALQKVRWLYRAQKAGHTGALDPLATGLLPICLGEATKFSHYLLEAKKRYQTTIQLGSRTTTGDVEGEVFAQTAIPSLSTEHVEQVLEQFLGDGLQTPPMYSALKKDGRPLYELARQGIEIERPARPIHIYAIHLIAFTEDTLTIDVTCSKGTYIRVLGEDIAQALGTTGHLKHLHRLETGHFTLDATMTIEYLESLSEMQRDALLLPAYAAVENLPRYELAAERVKYFCNGQESSVDFPQTEAVLVFSEQRCLGLAQVSDKQRLIPQRVLNLTE